MNRKFSHAIALIIIVALAGCTQSNTGGAKGQPKETVVTTGKPAIKTLRRVIEQPATIEAYEETPLVARIAGYVDKVHADIGKRVKHGELLAELSVPEMLQELKQKEALVTQARAEVAQSEAAKEAAGANIGTARAMTREAEAMRARAEANYDRWKSELARVEKLVADKVVDKQIRDESLNQYKSAEASRKEVEAKVQSAEASVKESEAKLNRAAADIDAARARVLVAQAEEGRLKALVEYRNIRAPFAGVVTRRNIHSGHFLQPNPGSGTHVVYVVARTDVLRIQAEIPEAEAIYISEGASAKVRIPALREQSFDGKVARTSVALDAKSRTLRVEIDFANTEGSLRPGMYANLVFDINLPDRRTLPGSAIFMHADQPCCWRVVDGKAVRTLLKLGVRDGQAVEVLKMAKVGEVGVWEDVTGQEEIVLTNLGSVTEGKPIPN